MIACSPDNPVQGTEEPVRTGIPVMRIFTDSLLPVVSKIDYLGAVIEIDDNANIEEISSKIRGRGNYTWEVYPKKPYKIKLSKKQSLFGFPENKDWVLLADYCDRSLVRTAYMFEVSKAVGMAFTPHYRHIELYLNNEYQGVYLLTEQVEKGKSRINISEDGFIIEMDTYWTREVLSFPSTIPTAFPWPKGEIVRHFTFKYPDADDGDIVDGDDNYLFIVDFIKKMEAALLKLNDDPYDLDYLDFIDVHSFAKWLLVEELTSNYDPNYYFVLPSKQSKLMMYPFWDAEWSMGLWSMFWGEPPIIQNDVLGERTVYFPMLLKSPFFLAALQEELKNCHDAIINVQVKMNDISKAIEREAKRNMERWPEIEGNTPNVIFDSWQEEIHYVNEFYKNRIVWMEDYMNHLNHVEKNNLNK